MQGEVSAGPPKGQAQTKLISGIQVDAILVFVLVVVVVVVVPQTGFACRGSYGVGKGPLPGWPARPRCRGAFCIVI